MDISHGMALLKAKRGAQAKVARAVGLTRGAVTQWQQVPAEMVVKAEEASGIPREQLRPDLYRKAGAA